ncbi:proton-conducting transporter membrane subunit [Alisedimentitalea sp. MJ-SS2]|uniref:proton-conducting transporter transmembrane domain-containing protein n=1 Tax=Aliisedimentitalea sp. MJ-SS2 TaxID=3049795 RepID=UPI002912E7BC|nr:proton-conducting transporter membrane subunit [Alisedimentitalea sp. MJ-SS2]MDU8928837.1 proton-conducting transporter membrane subunit [Alisedimentitalea sp. MJ-SS2]
METWLAITLSMAIPTLAMVGNIVLRNRADLRDGMTLLAAVLTFACVLVVLGNEGSGTTEKMVVGQVMPGIELAFHVEPLGLMFALIASGLWILTHLYGIGYMRGNNESHHARFFAAFSLAIAATMGLAFSANMFTLFLFYELLTISTYPLVAHKGTPEAMRGARTYLGILMGTSIALLLVAVIWTWAVTGTLDFQLGGILEGSVNGLMVPILLGLYAFGIGKAALMPFHRWLPAAMVAPTPVSALLHAVAVVKAGVFTMLKVGVYIFGIDFLAETGASEWLMWLAAFSIVAASVVALTKDNLKARLAYSTVSQLSYITLGMALATSMGVIGGGMHIAMHAMGKITLFMCAGSIYVATHKTNISQMSGLGRAMPVTFIAFFVGALSIIGLPPLGGSWSKWLLIMGAASVEQWVMIGVLMASSLLNVAYLLPLVGKGFFLKGDEAHDEWAEAGVLVWLPPAITAFGCLVLFFYAGSIRDFLMPLVGGAP